MEYQGRWRTLLYRILHFYDYRTVGTVDGK